MKQVECNSRCAHNPWVEGSSPSGPKVKTPCSAGSFLVLWSFIIEPGNDILGTGRERKDARSYLATLLPLQAVLVRTSTDLATLKNPVSKYQGNQHQVKLLRGVPQWRRQRLRSEIYENHQDTIIGRNKSLCKLCYVY